jgi:asparagine synthase (glutamine-hydrolysing)
MAGTTPIVRGESMCGIAGIATREGLAPDDPTKLDAMLCRLEHRGPDDQHAICDRWAAIGARRLSIIDLETGRQPVTNEDGSIIASLNGEIYNYVELREQLVASGHQFRSHGDTETIVHLYEERGDDFVDAIHGMFAIAIWDSRQRRLVLARDRLGKKPLYWRLTDGRLSYGSELKSLLVDPTIPRTVDREGLARYLEFTYVPGPGTILEGVSKLLPASILTWDGGDPRIRRYWTLPFDAKPVRSLGEDQEECLVLLRDAVRLRLRSDVPVGAFLSGGIDSGIVVALMAEASATPVRTYSIGFDDARFDERAAAREIADRFGTDHTEEVVRLDAAGALPELAYTFDEPLADTSALPTYRVSQLAGADLKVVLTGDGGDEAFGGYRTYRRQALLRTGSRLTGAAHGPLAGLAGALLPRRGRMGRLGGQLQRWGIEARMPADERFVRMMTMTPFAARAGLLGSATLANQDAYLLRTLRDAPQDSTDRILYTDMVTYLPEALLVKIDRASMASSLEARSPLLDHRIFEFASRLPASRKVGIRGTKRLLRRIAETLLPAGASTRPKSSFSVPIDDWFRDGMGTVYRDLVLGPDSQLRDHLDQSTAAAILDEHRDGVADNGQVLWALLMFEQWARTWLSGEGGAGPSR